MNSINLRYWGKSDWLLPKLPADVKFDFIGCLAVEDRCTGAFNQLKSRKIINSLNFWEIVDPEIKDEEKYNNKIKENKAIINKYKGKVTFKTYSLLNLYSEYIEEISKIIENSNGNIALDISTFPKRFFFPLVKRILLSPNIKNFIVFYSSAETYSTEDLSANPDSWSHLPLFGPTEFPEPNIEYAFVGIGFMPFGLAELLSTKYSKAPVKFLFPFPPGPPNYQRTWEFVRKIEQTYAIKDKDKIIRVNANNTSDAYDRIISEIGNDGKVLFAPYGPKPISLAMALFATKNNSLVYYTQPRYYHPDYSQGIKDTTVYCIKLNGSELY